MGFTSVLTSLCFFALPTLAVTVSFDPLYDDPRTPLTTVTCSDGPDGLISKGYTTFGTLGNFPNIGGSAAVVDWKSHSCGTCWQLNHNGSSIFVLVIDHTDDGFNISKEAMDELTDGRAEELGRVNASVTKAENSLCQI